LRPCRGGAALTPEQPSPALRGSAVAELTARQRFSPFAHRQASDHESCDGVLRSSSRTSTLSATVSLEVSLLGSRADCPSGCAADQLGVAGMRAPAGLGPGRDGQRRRRHCAYNPPAEVRLIGGRWVLAQSSEDRDVTTGLARFNPRGEAAKARKGEDDASFQKRCVHFIATG
jgi:hypothetical protein